MYSSVKTTSVEFDHDNDSLDEPSQDMHQRQNSGASRAWLTEIVTSMASSEHGI